MVMQADMSKEFRERKRFELTINHDGKTTELKGIGYWDMYECLVRMCASKEGTTFHGKVLADDKGKKQDMVGLETPEDIEDAANFFGDRNGKQS